MAPFMNRKMIRLALTGKCGGLGASGPGLDRRGCSAASTRAGDVLSQHAGQGQVAEASASALRTCRREIPLSIPVVVDCVNGHGIYLSTH